MRTSIVIATHNEGENLAKTVHTVCEQINPGSCEVVVVDDASTDNSLAAVKDFPQVRIDRFPQRVGVARAKHQAAQLASGEILIFLDGHCKPEPGALDRIVEDVELADGQAVITPRICSLNVDNWQIDYQQTGHGYCTRLDSMQCHWLDPQQMVPRRLGRERELFESPNLQGCALGVSRQLYQRLRGFDTGMLSWGSEDVDFGVKVWLMGHAILHDPDCSVGHRYQASFDRYAVKGEHVLANQMRMARKHLSEQVWDDWLVRFGARHPQKLWLASWKLFQRYRETVEEDREFLMTNRLFDEFWYAGKFQLDWPALAGGDEDEEEEQEAIPFPGHTPSPSPSPSGSPRGLRRDYVATAVVR